MNQGFACGYGHTGGDARGVWKWASRFRQDSMVIHKIALPRRHLRGPHVDNNNKFAITLNYLTQHGCGWTWSALSLRSVWQDCSLAKPRYARRSVAILLLPQTHEQLPCFNDRRCCVQQHQQEKPTLQSGNILCSMFRFMNKSPTKHDASWRCWADVVTCNRKLTREEVAENGCEKKSRRQHLANKWQWWHSSYLVYLQLDREDQPCNMRIRGWHGPQRTLHRRDYIDEEKWAKNSSPGYSKQDTLLHDIPNRIRDRAYHQFLMLEAVTWCVNHQHLWPHHFL